MRRWLNDRKGTAAVEFAMIGVPFILLVIGTLEMALMFASQSVLQEATLVASRMIRTGQLQQNAGGNSEDLFREAVCDFAVLIPCSAIQFQVQDLSGFTEARDYPPAQFDADGNLINQTFDPGGVSDVVLIRVVYNYPVMTPLMQPILSDNGGGKRMMISTIVLQSEPYEFEEL